MMEAIQALFANKLIVDDRKPILTFRTSSIPILNNILAGDSGEWELLAPNVELWNQLLLVRFDEATAKICFCIVVAGFVRSLKNLE